MDPYGSYVCPSDFEAARSQRSNASIDESNILRAQSQQQRQLPPFREILGSGGHAGLEPAPTASPRASLQGNTMTRKTFQAASRPLKSEPASPEQLQTGSSIENFDTMSAQSSDSAYATHRHHRQNSSWTSPPHYSELASPYGSQQRPQCTIQTQSYQPKVEPILPSIHDITAYSPSYSSSSYPYGSSTGSYNDSRSYPIKAETLYAAKAEQQSYYDTSSHRYLHSYPQIRSPNTEHLSSGRYLGMYDHYSKGLTFPSPYSVEYIPSPTNSQHPVSPTVSNGEGCGLGPGGRKRRGNLPKQITEYLRNWFIAHIENPYPSEDDKQQFVHDTNLSINQISNWFINARRRHLQTWRAQESSRREAQTSATVYDGAAEHARRSQKSYV